MPGYYARQTCLNGHIISDYVGSRVAGETQPFCDKCGASTIINCQSCNAPQRGSYRDMPMSSKSPAAYCWNCGKSYPWTEKSLAAAAELVQEDELLSDAEKQQLTSILVDLTSENPRTTVAATRFKRLIKKAGSAIGEAVQKTIVDVASETAKKIILGS
jgi:hypothetical protein